MDEFALRNNFYIKYGKRIFDLTVTIPLLILFSSLIYFIGFLVRIQLGSPVFFKQIRPGKDEKLFTLYKFRTMTNKKDENGHLLPDQKRITPFGKFLRSTSLDELPELLNVIKGDMSLVGPRPLLVRYLPYFRENEKKRNKVLPGITGLAQITGRNVLNWDDRFKLDLQYISNQSFVLDLIIIFKSILVVFERKDILVGSEHILKDLDVERSMNRV
ncbi:MAG: sugar transferase [Vulcanibacillus sp.]